MPITQKHSIVCDDARQENNGKWILIGMYTPDMAVPQIPIVLPSIAFFGWIHSDRPGSFSFRMKLEHLESGRVVQQGMGSLNFPKPGDGISLVRFGGIQLISQGAYVFSMDIDGQSDRLMTQFSVLLNLPAQASGQRQG
jgi:hypothetical protein